MAFGGSIKLTGESEYKKALKEITQQLKEVSSESKAVASQYDATDRSEQAVTDQTKALNKQLDTQNQRLELMKNRYDELSRTEGTSAEELSKLRTQINNAQADANKTAKQIKDLGTETEGTGKKFSGLGDTLGKVGKAAGVAMAAIGTAAVAAGKKLFEMAKETAAAGDEIDKESQKLGLTAETYQKLSYAMDMSGSSISDLSKGIKTIGSDLADFQNGVEGASEKYEKLGISMTNTDGELKSSEEILLDTIEALSNMENETQRNAAAQEIFGKSASELNPLLNAGAQGIRDLMQEAEDYGMVMSNDAVKASADFDDAMTRLSGTVQGLKNDMVAELLPSLSDITTGFAGLLAGVEGADEQISAGVQALAESINNVLPAAMEVISSVLQAILAEAPEIFKNLAESLLNALPDILPVITEAITGLGQAVIELVPEILKILPELIAGIVEGSLDIISGLWDAILETFFGVEDESKKVAERIDAQNAYIRQQAEAFEALNPQLAEYDRLLSSSGNTLADINSEIKENEDKITETIKNAIQEQGGLRAEDLENIEQYNQRIIELQAERLEIYRAQQISELRKLELETGSITQDGAAQHLTNMQEALKQANASTEEAYTARLTTIEQKYQAMGQVGSKAYELEMQQAKAAHDQQLAENQSYYNSGIAILQEKSKQWIQMDADKWKTLSEQMSHYNMETDDSYRKLQLETQDFVRGFEAEADNYQEALANMDRYSANGFLNMAAEIKASGGEIDNETKVLAENILSSFDNLPEDMDNAGKQALLGMITGMDDEIPQLKNASQMTANEIVDSIKEFLGIHSPSTVLQEVGGYAAEGLENGLSNEAEGIRSASENVVTVLLEPFTNAKNDTYYAGQQMASGVWSGFSSQEWYLTSNVRAMMQRVTNAVKSEMKISSPSKVFAQIGDYMAQGLEVGFTDEMNNVTNSIRDAMPTAIDMNTSKSAPVSPTENMVEAFKQALGEMKIELDDETVGGFVDKTVTQLIYT